MITSFVLRPPRRLIMFFAIYDSFDLYRLAAEFWPLFYLNTFFVFSSTTDNPQSPKFKHPCAELLWRFIFVWLSLARSWFTFFPAAFGGGKVLESTWTLKRSSSMGIRFRKDKNEPSVYTRGGRGGYQGFGKHERVRFCLSSALRKLRMDERPNGLCCANVLEQEGSWRITSGFLCVIPSRKRTRRVQRKLRELPPHT